ncbi:hypothetical protein CEXT_738101 [Caerostris extrusa]|uniref:Uncharacterized protein n=1 Tax=Caerostris extrusa TaxID=172846 RepID=A0AAV4TC03_CAEEX|nr:hypothetical protein CEXT_738101 [Caerostris extrusa]
MEEEGWMQFCFFPKSFNYVRHSEVTYREKKEERAEKKSPRLFWGKKKEGGMVKRENELNFEGKLIGITCIMDDGPKRQLKSHIVQRFSLVDE